jgi:hypothetical protein
MKFKNKPKYKKKTKKNPFFVLLLYFLIMNVGFSVFDIRTGLCDRERVLCWVLLSAKRKLCCLYCYIAT